MRGCWTSRAAGRDPRPRERLSKEVGQLRRDGDLEAAEQLQAESRELGADEQSLAAEHDAGVSGTARAPAAHPQPAAPRRARRRRRRRQPGRQGPDRAADGRLPSTSGCRTGRPATALGILDNERAAKISGAMFTMQRGAGRNPGAGAVPVRARPQRRRVRGDPAAVARDHGDADRHRPAAEVRRRRLLASSATTCGASRPPRCR